jgi:hypothetical protein
VQDDDSSMRFRAIKTLVKEIHAMGAIDLSLVSAEADCGTEGIRALLCELQEESEQAAAADAAVASLASSSASTVGQQQQPAAPTATQQPPVVLGTISPEDVQVRPWRAHSLSGGAVGTG